jgi:hypothetical protein
MRFKDQIKNVAMIITGGECCGLKPRHVTGSEPVVVGWGEFKSLRQSRVGPPLRKICVYCTVYMYIFV